MQEIKSWENPTSCYATKLVWLTLSKALAKSVQIASIGTSFSKLEETKLVNTDFDID